MSMDRSLKAKGSLARHRNVLSRAERIKILEGEDRWKTGDRIFGLAKVAHRKTTVGGKAKKEKKAEAEAAAAGGEGEAAEKTSS